MQKTMFPQMITKVFSNIVELSFLEPNHNSFMNYR